MGVFLRNKTQNPVFLPYPYRGLLRAGARVAVNLTEEEAFTALALVPGEQQNVITVEAGALAPFNDLVTGDAADGLLIGAIQSPIALSNTVIVQQLADFPSPAAGVITLATDTLYIVNGPVSLSSNRLLRSSGSQLAGFSSALRDSLSSTNVGALITNPGSDSSQFDVKDLTLVSNGGTVFDIDGSPARFRVENCIVAGEFGTASGSRQGYVNCVFTGFSTGVKFSTGGLSLSIDGCSFLQTPAGSGICIDLGSNVWTEAVSVGGNVLDVAPSGTGINGLASNGNIAAAFGGIQNTTVLGSGTALVGITEDDVRWLFSSNIGNLLNSSFLGRYGFTGSITTTPTTAVFTKVLGTTTATLEKRFLHVADNRMDYVGLESAPVRIDVALGSFKTGGASIGYEFAVFKNGVNLGPKFPQIVDNKGATLSFVVVEPAAVTSNFFDVRVANLDNTDAITISDMTVLLTRL